MAIRRAVVFACPVEGMRGTFVVQQVAVEEVR